MIPPWLEELCFRLSRNDPELANLNLNIRRFVDTSVLEALTAALEQNSVLHTLNLTSSLVKASIFPLANVLQHHRSLRILHLSYNRISDNHEIEALARAIATNESLVELYLDHNEIDANGAIILANALRQNDTLQVLLLSSNQVHDKGAEAIANVLANDNASIQRLCLERNKITSRGAEALLRALAANVTIQDIELDKHQSSVHDELDLALRTNRAGRRLLRHQDVPLGLWPYVLGRISQEPDMLCFFLMQVPNLCRQNR